MAVYPGDRERELARRAVINVNQFHPCEMPDVLANLRSDERYNAALDLVEDSFPDRAVGRRNTIGLDPEALHAAVAYLLTPDIIAQS